MRLETFIIIPLILKERVRLYICVYPFFNVDYFCIPFDRLYIISTTNLINRTRINKAVDIVTALGPVS